MKGQLFSFLFSFSFVKITLDITSVPGQTCQLAALCSLEKIITAGFAVPINIYENKKKTTKTKILITQILENKMPDYIQNGLDHDRNSRVCVPLKNPTA